VTLEDRSGDRIALVECGRRRIPGGVDGRHRERCPVGRPPGRLDGEGLALAPADDRRHVRAVRPPAEVRRLPRSVGGGRDRERTRRCVTVDVLPPTERDGPPSWSDIGRYLALRELWSRRQDVTDTTHDVEQALQERRAPTAGEIDDVRRAIERHQEFLEEYIVPFCRDDDVQPWGQRPRGVPFGQLEAWAHPDRDHDRDRDSGRERERERDREECRDGCRDQ